MSKDINTFQDLIIEEFDIEDSVQEDDLEESMDMLDIVMTENDEKRVEFIESEIDPFLVEMDLKIENIVKEERIENMNLFMDYFDEDSDILEAAIDSEIEYREDLEYEDEGEIIDTVEGLPDIDGDDDFI